MEKSLLGAINRTKRGGTILSFDYPVGNKVLQFLLTPFSFIWAMFYMLSFFPELAF